MNEKSYFQQATSVFLWRWERRGERICHQQKQITYFKKVLDVKNYSACGENRTILFLWIRIWYESYFHKRISVVFSLVLLTDKLRIVNMLIVVLWPGLTTPPTKLSHEGCFWWKIPLQILHVKLSPAMMARAQLKQRQM